MPWVEFKERFRFKPEDRVTIVYPAGFVGSVKAACADQAVAEGKANRLSTPRKTDGNIRKGDRASEAPKEA